VNWRPLYQLKVAALEGLLDWATMPPRMIALVFYLPTILLWLFTIFGGRRDRVKTLRWATRMLFGFTQKAQANSHV